MCKDEIWITGSVKSKEITLKFDGFRIPVKGEIYHGVIYRHVCGFRISNGQGKQLQPIFKEVTPSEIAYRKNADIWRSLPPGPKSPYDTPT